MCPVSSDRVLIIPNISVSLSITAELCHLILQAYPKSTCIKMELLGRSKSGKSSWFFLMGPSSCSQILVDTLVLPQIDVSVTLPMAKGSHREAGHGFGFGVPCAVKTLSGIADWPSQVWVSPSEFWFLSVLRWWLCRQLGGFGSCGCARCWNRECESVGVRMKARSYRWCLLKSLIACSKILPATQFTSCLKLLVK